MIARYRGTFGQQGYRSTFAKHICMRAFQQVWGKPPTLCKGLRGVPGATGAAQTPKMTDVRPSVIEIVMIVVFEGPTGSLKGFLYCKSPGPGS